jgi:hypothetical protein
MFVAIKLTIQALEALKTPTTTREMVVMTMMMATDHGL